LVWPYRRGNALFRLTLIEAGDPAIHCGPRWQARKGKYSKVNQPSPPAAADGLGPDDDLLAAAEIRANPLAGCSNTL
jgi:hypothetical protein